MKINNIACIGAGFVGGPTMAVIALKCPEINVTVVDKNPHKIEDWNGSLKNLPIYEPGLSDIIGTVRNKNLFFSTNIREAIEKADMVFMAVNTPTKSKGVGKGYAADLSNIENCALTIGKYAKNDLIVVEKSTLPVRTAEKIKEVLEKSNKSVKFDILSNPEFLAEGTAVNDLFNSDRVLIGGEDSKSGISAIDKLREIYLKWIPEEKIIITNVWSSELSKLVSNAMLAQRISSINSISAICEHTGADIMEISKAVGMDKRIGNEFLNPSIGFGGSCFKKDILNLVYICDHYGLHTVSKYWNEVLRINVWQQKRISSIIVEKLFGTISDKKITILGLAFKANTNDTRESPAIKICEDLIEEGAILKIYDPKVKESQIKKILPEKNQFNWSFYSSVLEAAYDSHAIVVLTEWEDFKDLDWTEIKKIMKNPSWVFDTRNIINVQEAKSSGLQTWVLGQST